MELDLSKIKHVHFIGIGGIGISAVARMLFLEGKNISANDLEEFEMVSNLRKLGINTTIGKDNSCIPKDVDLIVYSTAWTTLGPELLEYAKSLNTPMRTYPEMLGLISKDKYTIAVSGTHGKTTTTAMITQILRGANYDPTVIIGSMLVDEKSNFIAGLSKYFVVEACEYRRSFLNINPKILIITNIDEDHLDYYKDIEDIKNAFRELAMKVPSDGYVVCNPDDKNIKDVIGGIKAKVINWQEYFDADLKLKIPGIHNKKDAAGAKAVADILSISKNEADKYLAEFPGTWKRFEFRGRLKQGTLLYDDYAHHPTEIKATLEGFRELYPKNGDLSADKAGWKITVVFQPHLFSRTKLLLNDFGKCFNDADEVFILPIYYARDFVDGSISSEILEKEINKNSQNAKSFSDFPSLEKFLEARLDPLRHEMSSARQVRLLEMEGRNVIVTMGAGEASKIGDFLLKK